MRSILQRGVAATVPGSSMLSKTWRSSFEYALPMTAQPSNRETARRALVLALALSGLFLLYRGLMGGGSIPIGIPDPLPAPVPQGTVPNPVAGPVQDGS